MPQVMDQQARAATPWRRPSSRVFSPALCHLASQSKAFFPASMQADSEGSVTLTFFMMTSVMGMPSASAIWAKARFTGSHMSLPGSAVVQAPLVT